jgi:predicted DNA-binding transcriptional regulator AlpA
MSSTTYPKGAAGSERANSPARTPRRGKRVALTRGTSVIWAAGLQERYGISAPTRWRWEKTGRLPPRDVHIGGRSGWRPETIEAAEQKPSS